MFILVFVVSFGPKKGTIVIYSDSWYLGFYQTFSSYPKYLKKYNKIKLTETEKLSKQILTLPIFPDMTKKEALYVTNTINKFYKINNL